MKTECGLVPSSGTTCIANIGLIDNRYVTGGPYLIQLDKHGVAYVPMFNCAPYDIELQRNEFVVVIKNVKQFKIPDAHMEEVEKHVVEWLKLGVIEPARSKYNSLIFAVTKKNGGI